MKSCEQRHEKILSRIFQKSVLNIDQAKSQRLLEKIRVDKAYNNDILGILGQHKIIETSDSQMNQQLNNIMTQIGDIDSISKFHDDHFKIKVQQPFSPYVTPVKETLKTHMSFQIRRSMLLGQTKQSQPSQKVPSLKEIPEFFQPQKEIRKKQSMFLKPQTQSTIHMLSKRHSQVNIVLKSKSLLLIDEIESSSLSSQFNLNAQDSQLKQLKPKKVRVLSREELYKILKAHQDKTTMEPFTFKRFQKDFQSFWDQRVRTMTKEEREILLKLQNKEEEILEPEQTKDNAVQINIQALMKEEFERLYIYHQSAKSFSEQNKLKYLMQQIKKKGDLKPILGFRCQRFIEQVDVQTKIQKDEDQQIQEEEENQKVLNNRNFSVRSPSLENRAKKTQKQISFEDEVLSKVPSNETTFITGVNPDSPLKLGFNHRQIHNSDLQKSRANVLKNILEHEPKDNYFNQKLQTILQKEGSIDFFANSIRDEKLTQKIKDLFKFSLEDLIDDLTVQKDIISPSNSIQSGKNKSCSEYQRSMRKCDEIMDRWQSTHTEMPSKDYEVIKKRVKGFRKTHTRSIQLYTK